MKSKTLLAILGAVAVFGVLIALVIRSQRVLEHGLPPRVECASALDAWQRANAFCAEHGGSVISVLGTGSMQPYIPAAPEGVDPKKFVAAYVVTMPGARFEDITPGAVCTYRPEIDSSASYIHGAALLDRDGWIMSGLHNPRSESWAGVTAANFTGIAARTFVWPISK